MQASSGIVQYPFADIFEQLKVSDWLNSTKEGQVKTEFDRDIGKNVVVISGATSASNYIYVPKSKPGTRQSLSLMAKYVGGLRGS